MFPWQPNIPLLKLLFVQMMKISVIKLLGPLKEGGGGGSGAMCYVQNSLACYVLCKFLFTLLCENKMGCYAEI